MSAEIPWTVGPGEVLPKAPAVEPCGEVVVTVDGGYTHTSNPCNSPKYHDGPHTGDEIKAPPAQDDSAWAAKSLAEVKASELRYTQAQWDELALDLQAARAAVAYWQAKAEGR